MEPAEFIRTYVANSPKQRCFFHFTDERNLASIKKQGILSARLLQGAGVKAVYGGNDRSRDADKRFGMDRYVHLCFMKGHPMEYLARNQGRIKNPSYLEIAPEILNLPDGLVSMGVSNSHDVERLPINDGLDKLDAEVIYRYTRGPESVARWRLAHKCEILILDKIPSEYIRNL